MWHWQYTCCHRISDQSVHSHDLKEKGLAHVIQCFSMADGAGNDSIQGNEGMLFRKTTTWIKLTAIPMQISLTFFFLSLILYLISNKHVIENVDYCKKNDARRNSIVKRKMVGALAATLRLGLCMPEGAWLSLGPVAFLPSSRVHMFVSGASNERNEKHLRVISSSLLVPVFYFLNLPLCCQSKKKKTKQKVRFELVDFELARDSFSLECLQTCGLDVCVGVQTTEVAGRICFERR